MAKWESKVRKNNGELLKAPRTQRTLYLKHDNEFILSEERIQDIIGLSYDQFCKTVMLNQGRFAKFITSSFTERKDILESIYGQELIKEFSPKLRSNISALKHQKDLLLTEQNALDCLEEEQIEKANEIIENARSELPLLEDKINSFTENKKALDEIMIHQAKIETVGLNLESSLELLKSLEDKHLINKNKIHSLEQEVKEHNKLLDAQMPKIETAIKISIQLSPIKKQLADLNSTKIKLNKRLEDFKDNIISKKHEEEHLKSSIGKA